MECLVPINIANNSKLPAKRRESPMMVVPCGRCINCTQRKAREWAFKLYHENKISDSGAFITLTYNDESIPINESYTYPEFDKQDVISFMKRLKQINIRKAPENKILRYYLVAEYGAQTGRPHYHMILFNLHPSLHKNLHKSWYKTGDKKKRTLGNIHIGDVSMDTISYVAGYIMKRDIYRSDEFARKREFANMSKNLGDNYIKDNFRYHQENLTYQTIFQESPMLIPDQFRRKIFTDEQREQIGIDMKMEAEERKEKSIESFRQKGFEYPKAAEWDNRRQRAKNLESQLKKDKF